MWVHSRSLILLERLQMMSFLLLKSALLIIQRLIFVFTTVWVLTTWGLYRRDFAYQFVKVFGLWNFLTLAMVKAVATRFYSVSHERDLRFIFLANLLLCKLGFRILFSNLWGICLIGTREVSTDFYAGMSTLLFGQLAVILCRFVFPFSLHEVIVFVISLYAFLQVLNVDVSLFFFAFLLLWVGKLLGTALSDFRTELRDDLLRVYPWKVF